MDIDTFEEQAKMAVDVSAAVDLAVNGSDRSRQSNTNVLGVSDIGNCHEYVRRMIIDEEPSQNVNRYDLAAFIGTALGDHAEDAMIRAYPDAGWTKQAEVIVRLEVRGYVLSIPGHPDLFNRTQLIDFKSKDGLAVIRRTGPSDQERFQRSLYAKALIESGDMDEDCWLHNVYIDRSGQSLEPVVWSEKFSWAVVEEAVEWLDSVLYAVQMGEEAQRDPSREWCWACCPFAPNCRGVDDSDVQGKITDPFVIEAIRIYTETSEQIKALEKDKRSASSALRGVEGVTDSHTVRWISVGESVIPETRRAAYDRLDLRPVRLTPAARKRREQGK